MRSPSPLFKIEHVSKDYSLRRGFGERQQTQIAVNSVSLEIFEGECLALIGESGSGKSSLGKCILRICQPDSGSVFYKGIDLLQLSEKEFRPYRPEFQMIFQNSTQALNPRQSVGNALTEPLCVHKKISKRGASRRAVDMLKIVGLGPEMLSRFPDELSGGQRQRVTVARALMLNPVFLVADEPTSSLDAILKGQIIELLGDLQQRFGLTLLLISHDLTAVSQIADRVAVMYKGEIVEIAPIRSLIQSAKHPYSKVLLRSAMFDLKSDIRTFSDQNLTTREGNSGCGFVDRCPHFEKTCFERKPQLDQVGDQHSVACHLADEAHVVHTIESGTVQTLNQEI